MSPVFCRREWLAEVATLIGCARVASRNRALIAAADGACFAEGGLDMTMAPGAAIRSSLALAGWIWARMEARAAD